MVYLHFPPGHTEEELMLQTKYEKLKRKKKAVQILKTPSRNEPGDRHLVTGSHHHHHGSGHHHHHLHQNHAAVTAHHTAVQQAAGSAAAKRARCEARDAREIARKLLKSGAIAAIQKTPRREQQAGGFKRPCGLERKLERSTVERPMSGYQPFSATQPEDFNNVTTVAGFEPDRPRNKKEVDSPSMGGVVSGGRPTRETTSPPLPLPRADFHVGSRTERAGGGSRLPSDQPKEGSMIYVATHQSRDRLTEDFLRRTFRGCGKIIKITTESDKNCGFVTFDTKEAAAAAISEYHSCMVSNVQLKVTYSRRQPPPAPVNGAHFGTVWSSIAANNSQKGSCEESREAVNYSDNPFV